MNNINYNSIKLYTLQRDYFCLYATDTANQIKIIIPNKTCLWHKLEQANFKGVRPNQRNISLAIGPNTFFIKADSELFLIINFASFKSQKDVCFFCADTGALEQI